MDGAPVSCGALVLSARTMQPRGQAILKRGTVYILRKGLIEQIKRGSRRTPSQLHKNKNLPLDESISSNE